MMKKFETVSDLLADSEELKKIKEIFELNQNVSEILKVGNKEGYHLPRFQSVVDKEVASGGGHLIIITRLDAEKAELPQSVDSDEFDKPVLISEGEEVVNLLKDLGATEEEIKEAIEEVKENLEPEKSIENEPSKKAKK